MGGWWGGGGVSARHTRFKTNETERRRKKRRKKSNVCNAKCILCTVKRPNCNVSVLRVLTKDKIKKNAVYRR